MVIFAWDPHCFGFWLSDYIPALRDVLARHDGPAIAELEHALGCGEVTEVPIPHDGSDGFLGVYWRRPAM